MMMRWLYLVIAALQDVYLLLRLNGRQASADHSQAGWNSSSIALRAAGPELTHFRFSRNLHDLLWVVAYPRSSPPWLDYPAPPATHGLLGQFSSCRKPATDQC